MVLLARKPFHFITISQPNPLTYNASMSWFSLSTALSMLDVPLPEDNDMSDDEFDGYLDDDGDAQGCENELRWSCLS